MQSIAEDEPQQKRLQKAKQEHLLEIVDTDIEREQYNCAISEHIFERIVKETELVKKKVKEIEEWMAGEPSSSQTTRTVAVPTVRVGSRELSSSGPVGAWRRLPTSVVPP